jgi:N-acylneuraminate cytidylyltransferase
MVSTDDAEIAEVAKQYGASVPFIRSKENSDDYVGTTAVLMEVLAEYAKSGKTFNYVCCIYPTAPLVTSKHLIEGITLLKEKKFDVVYPVVKFGHPVQRALVFTNESHINYLWAENQKVRTQDLTPTYHDAGQWYWLIAQSITNNTILNHGAIIVAENEVQDIDNEVDWKLAELKYKLVYA